MKYSLLAAALFALSGLVLAQEQPADLAERLRQLKRDLPLIETLVQEGLNLAAQESPLARAQTCNVLADKLVQEIKQAAVQRDQQRASSLGNYLQAVLVRGVAGNLNTARTRLPGDTSPGERRRIRDRALRITDSVAEHATREMEQKRIMQPAIDAVAKGRAAVENAIAEKGQPQKR